MISLFPPFSAKNKTGDVFTSLPTHLLVYSSLVFKSKSVSSRLKYVLEFHFKLRNKIRFWFEQPCTQDLCKRLSLTWFERTVHFWPVGPYVFGRPFDTTIDKSRPIKLYRFRRWNWGLTIVGYIFGTFPLHFLSISKRKTRVCQKMLISFIWD